MIRRSRILGALLLLGLLLGAPAAARAEIEFVPEETTVAALDSNGNNYNVAGAHPYAYTFNFKLKTDGTGHTEGGEMRDVLIDLPPGFVGNPQAVPQCTRQQFEGGNANCPLDTQIGVLEANVISLGQIIAPLFNLAPPPGSAAQLGISILGFTSLQYASVLTGEGYGLRVAAPNLPLETTSVTARIWGTPAEEGHDAERGQNALNGGAPVKSTIPPVPFLTLPASCGTFLDTTIRIDSKLNPGVFISETARSKAPGGALEPITGCEGVPFEPQVTSVPTTKQAGSASGLAFDLTLPGKGLVTPGGVAETEPMKTEVTFPAGLAVNPSAANGISACTLEQFNAESAESLPGQGCPEASKVGTLLAKTPLLEEPINGSVYLAAPQRNAANNSFLAIYIVARALERGVLVKQAGEVHADPVTGQLTTVVDKLPPLPYSSFELDLRDGPRGALVTPQTCGTYTAQVKNYPFSAPSSPTVQSVPFTISSGAGGANCASTESQLPNKPTLEAGTAAPVAGSFSPFLFKVTRSDGDQRFSSITATLPKGLTGKLAGIPYCSDPQIAAAESRNFIGGGAAELASPSCPSASQVGVVNVGAGAGPQPFYVQGKAYLAGPYKGAPLSMVIITPGVAGPFDLGAVVARAGLYVDESTAQITVKSDPIPTILQGIPLDVRSIAVRADRDSFTLNPTNCEAMSITGSVTSTSGSVAPVSNRFRVGGCKGLDFSPKLSLSLNGATKRTGHPAFKAVLTQPKDQANIGRTSVALPPTEFIDPLHVANPCTRPEFAAGKCPATSILGKATAYTPLLDKPLTGKVYFRSNGGERALPDVVADLNGQVHFVLVGQVDALHKKGSEASRVRTTFATVPDAPVTKFVLELRGGKKHGLLVNSANICTTPNKAIVKMRAQNGKTNDFNPTIATSCRKRK